MRVGIFVPSLSDRDAVGRDVIGMARAIRAAGYASRVVCQDSSSTEYRARHYSGAIRELDSPTNLLVYHHCTFTPEADRVLRSVACRKVLRYHNVTPPEFLRETSQLSAQLAAAGRRQTAELIAAGFDEFWATSQYNRAELIAGGAPAERCRVLPPFHYVDRLLAQPLDRHLTRQLSDGKVNLLNVGRLVPNKNHLLLLRSFARFRERNTCHSRLIIVGKSDAALGDWRGKIRRLIAELDLTGSVLLAGCIDDASLSSYFRSAHVYVSASRHEGFYIPLIEAMAHGVPVVALARAAVPETVGEAGVLVEDEDAAEMAAATYRVVESVDLQKTLMQNGRRRYRERFSQQVLETRLRGLVAPFHSPGTKEAGCTGNAGDEAEIPRGQRREFRSAADAARPLGGAVALTVETATQQAEAFIRTIPEYPKRYDGRGIVICAGGARYNACAWVLINILRQLGCRLPIQVWYCGDRERDDDWKSLVKPLGVECVDAFEVQQTHPHRRLEGWALKPYALLHSPYREALLLDADIVPVQDPSFLFDCRQYRATGAVFWPDDGRTARDSLAWRLFGVEHRDEPEQESGQVLVDKQRHWRAMNLCNWYNEHADFFYQYVYGDKDAFRFAWHRLEEPFTMPSHTVGKLSRSLVQFDFHGQPLFQHRCMDKWSLAGNCRIPGFIHESRCFQLIDELRARWRPRLAVNGRRNQSVEDELRGHRFVFTRQGVARWPLKLGDCPIIDAGHSSGFVFWWADTNRLVLADADGRVKCSLERIASCQWRGTDIHDHRQVTCLKAG